jgi:hypothetical protein
MSKKLRTLPIEVANELEEIIKMYPHSKAHIIQEVIRRSDINVKGSFVGLHFRCCTEGMMSAVINGYKTVKELSHV